MKPLVISLVSFIAFCHSPIQATESKDAPDPAVIQHVVAVKEVCAWPNLTLLRDGTIIAIFHNRPSHGQQEADIDCYASTDGIEWTKRSTITQHDPDTIRMNHAAGLAANGDLVVLCSGWTDIKQTERPKQDAFRDAVIRSWVLRSSDGGKTWDKREQFPAPESGWCEYIPFGDIWAGEDGALHVSCYHGKFKDPTQSFKTDGWRSWHLKSLDDGKTWETVSVIGERHNETALFYLGGKDWLAAARIDKMELIRSSDNGLTWEQPVPVTKRNEINGQIIRLKDNRLLLAYGVRVDGGRGVCAKFSKDEGKTWGTPVRLARTIDGGDCGYPSSVQLPSGKIATAWYSKESPQHTGYHMGVSVWEAPEK